MPAGGRLYRCDVAPPGRRGKCSRKWWHLAYSRPVKADKKYTNNLTIVYDGDAAGIKAALRGLEMALEESLNVKLVLIPDKEDPDSYVRLVGANAFKEFVAANKKDFILFQLEILLKDAGTDISKKNEIVNQIAETISKINKAEDFTRQQEYIRQSATLLKIDESGFTNLVNKFIKERLSKEEKKTSAAEAKLFDAANTQGNEKQADDAINLLMEDEFQEREVVKGSSSMATSYWPKTSMLQTPSLKCLTSFTCTIPNSIRSLWHTRKCFIKRLP